MKNKNFLFLTALMLFLSCSKTFEPTLTSESVDEVKIPDHIPQGYSDTTCAKSKGTFPNDRIINYHYARVSVNEIFNGTKKTHFFTDQQKATPGTLTQKNVFSKGFQIGYLDDTDTSQNSVEWKLTKDTSWKYVYSREGNLETYRILSHRNVLANEDGNESSAVNEFYLQILNKTERSKTGGGYGRDIIAGEKYEWKSEIQSAEPVLTIKGEDYPVAGRIRYTVNDNGIKSSYIIDWGNGTIDNKAKKIQNGVVEDIYAPFHLPGEYYTGNYD